MLKYNELSELLDKMRSVRAVLLGDMCIDIYWSADMTKSVLSRETAHFPLPVVEERMSLGAGGNALKNLTVLCDNVQAVGIKGNDWRGNCIERCFEEIGLDTSYIITDKSRVTNAYIKPMRFGYLGIETEDPRIDFESFDSINKETEDMLIEHLKKATENADVLCVSDQFLNGCVTERVREAINSLDILKVVDSRYRIGEYRNAFLKPNEIECARALGLADNTLTDGDEETVVSALTSLNEKTGSSVCITLGPKGARTVHNGRVSTVEAPKVLGQIDTCGAGDCFLSAFALALSTGATEADAAFVANLASQVSIKKINTTGSASREEILARYREAYE